MLKAQTRPMLFALGAIVALLAFLPTSPAEARIQRDMVCWVPDCEFPVDCDEEEE